MLNSTTNFYIRYSRRYCILLYLMIISVSLSSTCQANTEIIIPVEVYEISENAQRAKEKATERAIQHALNHFTQSRLAPSQKHIIRHIPNKDSANIISSIRYIDEKVYKDRYFARLDLSIDVDILKRYLRTKGVHYVNQHSLPMMVIPIIVEPDGELKQWENPYLFLNYLDNNQKDYLVPLSMPFDTISPYDLSFENIRFNNPQIALDLKTRYQVEFITFLLFFKDKKGHYDSIHAVGWDSYGYINQKFPIQNTNTNPIENTLIDSFKKYINFIENRWKEVVVQRAGDAFKMNEIKALKIPFNALNLPKHEIIIGESADILQGNQSTDLDKLY